MAMRPTRPPRKRGPILYGWQHAPLHIVKDAAAGAKPCRVGFLVGESTGFHRAELRREKLRVAAPDSEHNERARDEKNRV